MRNRFSSCIIYTKSGDFDGQIGRGRLFFLFFPRISDYTYNICNRTGSATCARAVFRPGWMYVESLEGQFMVSDAFTYTYTYIHRSSGNEEVCGSCMMREPIAIGSTCICVVRSSMEDLYSLKTGCARA